MSNVSQGKFRRKKSRKTLAKETRARKLNHRAPNEQAHFASAVKTLLIQKLYNKQFMHWNEKLRLLCIENIHSVGREDDNLAYAIYWNHKRYSPVNGPFADADQRAYCIPLNPHMPQFTERMAEIAEELDGLYEEKYEAERFIANLLSFNAPSKCYEEALGATLYRVVKKAFEDFCDGCGDWDPNRDYKFKMFVEFNKPTIEKMNERVVINLVTL